MSNPLDLIYDGFTEEGRQKVRRHRKPPLRIRASEVSNCSKRIWFRLSGYVPRPRGAEGYMYGPSGDFAHDSARWLLKDAGVHLAGLEFDDVTGKVTETMNVTKTYGVGDEEFDLVCRADGMILLDDIWHLLEIKSVGAWIYSWMDKALNGKYLRFGPGGPETLTAYLMEEYKSYVWQSTVGMLLHNLDRAYLLVTNRSECQLGFKEESTGIRYPGMVWEKDEQLVYKILKRCGTIAKCVRNGKTPPCGHTASHKECARYCEFAYLCHGAAKRRTQGLEPHVVYPDATLADVAKERNPK